MTTPPTIHATTIIGVQHQGKTAIAGDGQVTFGNAMIMKHGANKLRRLYQGKVIAGFAGSVADALTLFDKFEVKLEEHSGSIARAAIELAKDWRSDRILRRLEAMMVVADAHHLLLLSGTGEIIEPDDGVLAIGSGSSYALAAGRALKQYGGQPLTAQEIARASLTIASQLCVYTNDAIRVEQVEEEVG